MRIMSRHMAATVLNALNSKRTPQMLFSDSNTMGFRIKSANAKNCGADMLLNDFVMVIDKNINPYEIMKEWNLKLADIEAES